MDDEMKIYHKNHYVDDLRKTIIYTDSLKTITFEKHQEKEDSEVDKKVKEEQERYKIKYTWQDVIVAFVCSDFFTLMQVIAFAVTIYCFLNGLWIFG